MIRFPRRMLSVLAAGLAALSAAAAVPTAAATPWLQVQSDPVVSVSLVAARIEANGPFTHKQLFVTLRNPSGRPLEASLLIPLAGDERLRGYALDVDGQLRDAVPVERVQARIAFEDTVRRNVDPALLEKDVGNAYRLRIFPLPPRGQRQVRIDIAALAPRMACGWQHSLVLGGAAGDTRVPLSVVAGGKAPPLGSGLAWQADPASTDWHAATVLRAGQTPVRFCLPAGPDVALFSARGGAAQGSTGGGTRHAPDAGPQALFVDLPVAAGAPAARRLPARVEIVWDASASMDRRPLERELALLRGYFKGRDAEVALTILRDTASASRSLHVTRGDIGALAALLSAEPADGATDFAAWRPLTGVDEVLLFTDAVASWPAAAPVQPGLPVFVVTPGAGADPALAAWLARGGGDVIALDSLTPADALARLTQLGPRLLPSSEPLAQAWQMASATPAGGALRACRFSPEATDAELAWRNAQGQRQVVRLRAADARPADQAAFWCAQMLAEALAIDADRHRAALTRLGRDFGIATLETSLLVLERDDDYVRHGIAPTGADTALRERVLRARQALAQQREREQAQHQAQLRQAWQDRAAWWATAFPKDTPPPPMAPPKATAAPAGMAPRPAPLALMATPPPAPTALAAPSASPPPPTPATTARAAVAATAGQREAVSAERSSAAAAAAPSIGLMTLRPDEPYIPRLLQAATPDAAYASYLDLRPDYRQSPAFYLDVAERLFALGDMPRAVRVLSNIVELLPRQPAALRIVAYRLQQAQLPERALPLLERVLALAPDEPQSARDLGLAQGALGHCQTAVDQLAQVALKPWPARFADIGLIALAELNDQATRCSAPPDLSAIDPELRAPLPLGLRAVLTWDLSDTDIDLWVIDPNGEAANYSHRATYQGGRLSRDFTAGYGPEEFVLRTPKPGRYRVELDYYGSRAARLARGVVAQIRLQTGFGSPALQTRLLTLRLAEKGGRLLVGTFDVAPDGDLRVAPDAAGR